MEVVSPHRRAGADEPRCGVRDPVVHLAVPGPGRVREVCPFGKSVEKRPETTVAESVVVVVLEAGRQIEPRELRARVRGELETTGIVADRPPAPSQPET